MQPSPRQESGQLSEPCHCGQTPRLPENKLRRGLEAAAEAGHHDLPSWASSRLVDRQVFISIQAALRKQEVEPTTAGWTPGTAPSINICSAPAPCLPGAGTAGRGKQDLVPAPLEGAAGPERVGNRTALGAFGEKSWSPAPWKTLPVASHQRLCTLLCENGLSPLGARPACP